MINDTVIAASTANGVAGVAVIRITGSDTKYILSKLVRSKINPINQPNRVTFARVVSPTTMSVIDDALVFYLPAPRTFTGEDMGEIQCHGNPLIVSQIISAALALGVRQAERGEFTRRAFENGKIDLTQSEAISDLIHAESESALKLAREQLSGKLRDSVNSIGEPLRDILAEVEAHIDFPEEEISPKELSFLTNTVELIKTEIKKFIDSYSGGQIAREGYRVLLCGPPNAGKSSLLNELLGIERAIVSDIAGTTRDLIEEKCQLKDHLLVLCDSAGLTETTDKIEQRGIELATQRVNWADLILLICPYHSAISSFGALVKLLEPRLKENSNLKLGVVISKIDLGQGISDLELNQISDHIKSELTELELHGKFGFIVPLTIHDSNTLDNLRNHLIMQIEAYLTPHNVSIVCARHHQAFVTAYNHLNNVISHTIDNIRIELIAEEIRLALGSLQEIVGQTYSEDILGRIFSKFCIGK